MKQIRAILLTIATALLCLWMPVFVHADSTADGTSIPLCDGQFIDLGSVLANSSTGVASLGSYFQGSTSCWNYTGVGVTADGRYPVLLGDLATKSSVDQFFTHGNGAYVDVTVESVTYGFGIISAPANVTISSAKTNGGTQSQSSNVAGQMTLRLYLQGGPNLIDNVSISGGNIALISVVLHDPNAATPTLTPTPTGTPPTATPTATVASCGDVSDCFFRAGPPISSYWNSIPSGYNPGVADCVANSTCVAGSSQLTITLNGSGSAGFSQHLPCNPNAYSPPGCSYTFQVWMHIASASGFNTTANWTIADDGGPLTHHCDVGPTNAGYSNWELVTCTEPSGLGGQELYLVANGGPSYVTIYEPCAANLRVTTLSAACGSLPSPCPSGMTSCAFNPLPTDTPTPTQTSLPQTPTQTPRSTPISQWYTVTPPPTITSTPANSATATSQAATAAAATATPNFGPWSGDNAQPTASTCTNIAVPIPATPPSNLFPSSVTSLFLLGGVVQAAANVVGGFWSMVVDLVVPQHSTCDFSPLMTAVASKIQVPDIRTAIAPIANPSPCGFLGYTTSKGGIFPMATNVALTTQTPVAIGIDTCSEPYHTIGPQFRNIITFVSWALFVASIWHSLASAFGGKDEGAT